MCRRAILLKHKQIVSRQPAHVWQWPLSKKVVATVCPLHFDTKFFACGEHSMTHLARNPATRLEVTQSQQSSSIYCFDAHLWRSIQSYSNAVAEELQKLISSALNKTCELDPALTWVVKDMRELLSPFILLLFNKSLTVGCFPAAFKEALVRPLLKKVWLDAGDQKNFRPVSNLPFLQIVGESCAGQTSGLSRE